MTARKYTRARQYVKFFRQWGCVHQICTKCTPRMHQVYTKFTNLSLHYCAVFPWWRIFFDVGLLMLIDLEGPTNPKSCNSCTWCLLVRKTPNHLSARGASMQSVPQPPQLFVVGLRKNSQEGDANRGVFFFPCFPFSRCFFNFFPAPEIESPQTISFFREIGTFFPVT